jgi:hypothetical protein
MQRSRPEYFFINLICNPCNFRYNSVSFITKHCIVYEKCLGQHSMKHLPHCNTSKTGHPVGWTQTIIVVLTLWTTSGEKKKFMWITVLDVSDDKSACV